MSKSNNQSYDNRVNDAENVSNMNASAFDENPLKEFFASFNTTEDFQDFIHHTVSLNTGTQNIMESPSQLSSYLNNQDSLMDMSNVDPQASTTVSMDTLSNQQYLQIVQQPCQRSKLRYRADYNREKRRLGVLGSKNEKKSRIKGPAICISQSFLNPNDEYYIRVCLVTVKHNKTNLHYFHPYDLEDPRHEKFNDRQNNAIWYPIEREDMNTGVKSFPLLRIVKKTTSYIQKLDNLPKFDCNDQNLTDISLSQPISPSEMNIIQEYNLERSKLAFTVGKKMIVNGQSTIVLYAYTTIFSEEMNDNDEKQSDTDTDTESISKRLNQSSSRQYVQKYAPRYGFSENNEDMLIMLSKKLTPKTLQNVQVHFEYNTFEVYWSQQIIDLEIKDQLISFKTPIFPYPITTATLVEIILRQDGHILDVLKYTYLPNGK